MVKRFFSLLVLSAVLLQSASTGCSRHDKWTTPSGLQVTELVEGEGELAKRGDVVSVLYTGWYVGGKQFISYQDRESPYQFRVGMKKVLPGFDEGVATMRPGGRRILVLPPELAFGEEGLPGTVPPDTWVKLEVELVGIRPMPSPPQPWNDAGHEILVTDTGLQYVDFIVGAGDAPTLRSTVTVHYSAFLDDGTPFDSSYISGRPVTFAVGSGELIPGWLEGIMTMRVGGKRKLIIPPYLGYGDQGYRDVIPGNATLIYDIELLAVSE